MPEKDADEIEKQVGELMSTGLVEPFPKENSQHIARPHFWWPKKVQNPRNGRIMHKDEPNDQMSRSFSPKHGIHGIHGQKDGQLQIEIQRGPPIRFLEKVGT